MRGDESTRFSGRCWNRRKSALKVVSHVPRIAPGIQTQEGNPTLSPDAGKTCFPGLKRVGVGLWPRQGEDPWDSKASRWMGKRGAALVRAGLLAWQSAQKEFPMVGLTERRIGVIGVVGSPSWPDWLCGEDSGEIAKNWKQHPPLWLLGCLPNLPLAQLAIEVGAKGPVETIRAKSGSEVEAMDRIRNWMGHRVDCVLRVQDLGDQAWAEVWQTEGK